MVVEHAVLRLKPGSDGAFRAAFAEARPLIAASPGFESIEVRPAAEAAGHYLLLVRWRSIADHRDGFRKSERYEQWRALLHPFYEPMPEVSYYGAPL